MHVSRDGNLAASSHSASAGEVACSHLTSNGCHRGEFLSVTFEPLSSAVKDYCASSDTPEYKHYFLLKAALQKEAEAFPYVDKTSVFSSNIPTWTEKSQKTKLDNRIIIEAEEFRLLCGVP